MHRANAKIVNGPMKPRDTARKTLLLCLIAMLIPVALCLILYVIYSSRTMEQEIYRNMRMSVEQAKNNMDYRMSQVERNALRILNTIYPYLNSDAAYSEQLAEYAEISQILSNNQSQNMITKLRLYVPNEKYYSHQHDTFFPLDELGAKGSPAAFGIGSHWQETHQITVQFGYPQVSVISCASAVTSIHNYNRLVGALFLDMDVSPFESMLSAGIAEEAQLFIVNQAGDVLIHPDRRMMGTNPFRKSWNILPTGSDLYTTSVDMNGERQLMATHKLKSADWYLVMTVPASSVFSSSIFSLDLVRIVLLVLIFASLLLALALTYNTLVRNTVRRINLAIYNSIDAMEKDGLSSIQGREADDRGNSPLVELERNTNLMAATISDLLERRYQDQLMVRDFQMQALQAQINPHFLYNTLDIIKWMIADGQNEDGIWMINALSRYFQLSLSSGRDIVCVEEEMRLTRTYIGIMQRRFKGVFTAEFDVERNTEHCLIPKLSLQPIVENALLHGILYADKPEKYIHIRAMLEEDHLIIEVEDNGNGMDADTINAILRQDGTTQGKGYGLSNVRHRLRLFGAKSDDDFQIISHAGFGTCVTLSLPILEKDGG